MTNSMKPLEEIIKLRRSTRNFSNEIPAEEILIKIITSAIYAPYGGATGIPLDEIRKVFVFRQDTENMAKLQKIFLVQMRRNAKKLNFLLSFLPFMKKKLQTFANKVNGIAKGGVPAMSHAAYFIVLAEKKGIPSVEKQSMAYAFENMWLMATDFGLGFQLVSAINTLSKNKDFLKLLNLKKGEYALDGCAIGYPKNNAEKTKKIDVEKFTVWM